MQKIIISLLLVLGSLVSSAQTIADPPKNPLNFLIRALEREAQTNLTGEVLETQIFPPRAEPNKIRADLPMPPFSPDWIRKNFMVTASFGEAIANRETWKISLEPRNSEAASFTFWIDQKWLLRLGIEERDSSNEMTFAARFNSFSGNPKPRQNPRQFILLENKPKLEAFVQRETALQLPIGFQLFDLRPRTVGKNNLPALELRASNGISVLVIVFAPIGTGNQARVAVRNISGSFVWVIGNLPHSDLEKTANSIKAPLDLALLMAGFQNLR